jgi:hypothetical protein
VGFFLGGVRDLELPVPVCEPCKEAIEQKTQRGSGLGLAIGAVVGTAIGLGLGGWLGEGQDLRLWLGAFAGLFAGSFAGSMIGLALSQKLPVRLRRYSPSRGVVSVRFENPEVAQRVIANLRQHSLRSSQPEETR